MRWFDVARGSAERIGTGLLTAILLVTPSAEAQSRTFWERVRTPALIAEGATLRSVERVLLGVGSDYDILAAQSALIHYMRGEASYDVRVELLLARLRLEAGWGADERLERRLERTLQRVAPIELRARGVADWASLAALRNDAATARERFSRALTGIWEADARAESLLGRGFASMALGDLYDAIPDFEQAVELSHSRRLSEAAYWALTAAHHRSGDTSAAAQTGRRAHEISQRRAQAAGVDVFERVPLVPNAEHRYLGATMALARADQSEDEEEREREIVFACRALWAYLDEIEPSAIWVGVARADVDKHCRSSE